MGITYLIGDATAPDGRGPGVIAHVCNGCGLAGGKWDQVEPLIGEHLVMAGFEVRVYDLPAT
jgi:hypothetical protein